MRQWCGVAFLLASAAQAEINGAVIENAGEISEEPEERDWFLNPMTEEEIRAEKAARKNDYFHFPKMESEEGDENGDSSDGFPGAAAAEKCVPMEWGEWSACEGGRSVQRRTKQPPPDPKARACDDSEKFELEVCPGEEASVYLVSFTEPRLGLVLDMTRSRSEAPVVKALAPQSPGANLIRPGHRLVAVHKTDLVEGGAKAEGVDLLAKAAKAVVEGPRPLTLAFRQSDPEFMAAYEESLKAAGGGMNKKKVKEPRGDGGQEEGEEAAASSSSSSPSTVRMAVKWAESPDQVFIFAKFAHKLDAPGVNDVKPEHVNVSLAYTATATLGTLLAGPTSAAASAQQQQQQRAYTVRIRAQHPSKRLVLDLPLRHGVDPLDVERDVAVSTFGVRLTLNKQELEHEWGVLLASPSSETSSSSSSSSKTAHIWWEVAEEHDAAMEALRSKGAAPLDWLASDPLGCESCRLAVEHALFSASSLTRLRTQPLPANGSRLSPTSVYNTSLHSLLKTSCDYGAFTVPPRHVYDFNRQGQKSDSGDEAPEAAVPTYSLRRSMRRACAALVKAKPKANRLLQAAYNVQYTLLTEEAIQAQCGSGWPSSLAELVQSPEGRALVRTSVDTVCAQQAPTLCPPSHESRVPDVGSEAGRCAVCGTVVGDLEAKALRFNNHHPKAAAAAASTERGAAEGAPLLLLSVDEEVEAVCEELRWRHYDDADATAYCDDLVEEKDDALALHALRVFEAGRPLLAVGSGSEGSKDSEAAAAARLKLCGCEPPDKTKGAKEGKKRAKGKKKAAAKKKTEL